MSKTTLWIARTKFGELTLHYKKPTLVYDSWWSSGERHHGLYYDIMPDLKFEDGPKQIKIELYGT